MIGESTEWMIDEDMMCDVWYLTSGIDSINRNGSKWYTLSSSLLCLNACICMPKLTRPSRCLVTPQCTWGCGITSPQCHTFGTQCGAQIHTGAYKADELVYQLLFIETFNLCKD